MTTTPLKSWQDPANAIPPDAPVACQIYVIWGWDPWQRGKGEVCLWVGESARFWLMRVSEHADKYWREDITRIEVVCDPGTGRPMRYGSKAAVWKVEEELTHKLLPVHSWEYNKDNPWVVRNRQGVHKPLPEVPKHWLKPTPGTRVAALPYDGPHRREPMGWFGKIAWATIGWVVVAGVVWILAAANASTGQPVSAKDGAGLGAVAASMLYGGIWWLRCKVRARSRTRKSR